ncbi:ankyrin repeat and LEM domain-containing protein 2 [Ambystoma mexicanum]|uniref:ankyrin repeat and LEM domain-containing protein 2 n=1 Tax=Ambystoma mexicanum TaxID=8296 RepID=UPI0037E816CF
MEAATWLTHAWAPAWPALLAALLACLVAWLLRLRSRGPGEGVPGAPEKGAEEPGHPAKGAEPDPKGVERVVQTMDTILTRLHQLNPDQLREEIVNAGLKCGPITTTTRFIFEKKLARELIERQGIGSDDSTSVLLSSNAAAGWSKSAVGHAPAQPYQGGPTGSMDLSEDGDFGYSMGLNPPEEVFTNMQSSTTVRKTDVQCTQAPLTDASVYYGVCPVFDDILARNDRVHVYVDKKEAMQAVKMMKGSRFKVFSVREDAEKFAKGICDYYPSPSKGSLCSSPAKPGPVFNRDVLSSPEADSANKERANSFKSPRTQDLTAKLRKAVEKGDQITFSELIWSNPRYLIGSGDNPTVVQEGCRYNVMHVAAKENQPAICHLILETLENPEFMRLMYPDDDEDMLQKRIKYIVDLYLNTPDKMGFDTPLHFACKFGSADVVNVLAMHPDIVKDARNKYNQMPEEVICERSKDKSRDLKEQIREYLQGRYYVPLLRAQDNSFSPVIGVPWSPETTDSVPLSPHPRFAASPMDPLLAVRAFAGPMSPSKAEDFRRIWKTPPRDRASFFHNVKKSDPERGVERVGRELAHELGFPWVEYWDFLGCFVDLSSQEGLKKLEEYLGRRDVCEKFPQEPGENETCNRYKTPSPSGKSKKCCNSISVGAFLDEVDDLSLEEIKNRQNAALNSQPASSKESSLGTLGVSECDILSIEHDANILDMATPCNRHYEKETSASKNGFCSLVDEHVTPSDRKRTRSKEDCLLSPVSNLMVEFEKMTFAEQEAARKSAEKSKRAAAELASASPVQYEKTISLGLSQVNISSGMEDGFHSVEDVFPKLPAAGDSLIWTEGAKRTLLPEVSLQGNCSQPLYNMERSMDTQSHKFITKTPPRIESVMGPFLLGAEPSKLDNDVLTALQLVDIDMQKYPALYKWWKTVQTYAAADRQSWPSPALHKGKHKTQNFAPGSPNTPGRNSPLASSPGKYTNTSDYASPGRYSPAFASQILLSKLRHFSDPSTL